jgi:hypothetical protein
MNSDSEDTCCEQDAMVVDKFAIHEDEKGLWLLACAAENIYKKEQDRYSSRYHSNKAKARRAGLDWALSKKQWHKIADSPCFWCHKNDSPNYVVAASTTTNDMLYCGCVCPNVALSLCGEHNRLYNRVVCKLSTKIEATAGVPWIFSAILH